MSNTGTRQRALDIAISNGYKPHSGMFNIMDPALIRSIWPHKTYSLTKQEYEQQNKPDFIPEYRRHLSALWLLTSEKDITAYLDEHLPGDKE